MGQIVRRKKKNKKGRLSSSDLDPRRSTNSPPTNLRRSLRRRTVRNNVIGYEDYLIDDDDDEEVVGENGRSCHNNKKKKKKLKLVTKLEGEEQESRVEHSREVEVEVVGDETGRKENENEDAEDEEVNLKCRKVDNEEGLPSVSGAPPNFSQSGIPLPDKRTLEKILDKLQKKDKYGVFAEPVDIEELPDYYDIIEYPMDFATVRKKLANASYLTLEQFENDVFLICSNAMQYNEPETIYHKQALSIQELGRKKFARLRIDFERSHNELKSELKTQSNSLVKKRAKKPAGHASREPVVSVGATLATVCGVQPTAHSMQGVNHERPGNIDCMVERNANQEKAEDLSGRGLLSKLGRKSFVHDESHHASYNMFNQAITESDSILMTFKSEMKQLVTVGLHAEYSYARSLARFSATLGPVAWKIASNRIQQALPAGCKFGRGWVGEYEPLPTPELMLDNHAQRETSSYTKFHSGTELIWSQKL